MVDALPPIPDTFALGVCDYPEHVPWEQWKQYPARQREMGLTYVRIAEFAWSKMEPAEGVFEWQWLDDAVEALHAEELKVVMCTPTATPPAWLIRKHPEILYTDKDGRVRNFGSRKHYDHASPIYREHSRRITTEIATRYGTAPGRRRLANRQRMGLPLLDPLLRRSQRAGLSGVAGTTLRHARRAERGLGQCLLESGVHRLESDRPAAPDRRRAEPSHVLDFYRFASDAVAEFQLDQTRILRELSPGRWITHNYMMHFSEFDHYTNCEPLDFASWDSYPTGQVERWPFSDEEKVRWARTGHPDIISFNHDLYRGLKGQRAFWVMEQGNGQVNWAPSNAAAGRGRGRALDRAGLCPWRKLRLLFPLARGHHRPGADALRSAPPRRNRRSRRRGSRLARNPGTRRTATYRLASLCCTTTRASGSRTRNRTARARPTGDRSCSSTERCARSASMSISATRITI